MCADLRNVVSALVQLPVAFIQRQGVECTFAFVSLEESVAVVTWAVIAIDDHGL